MNRVCRRARVVACMALVTLLAGASLAASVPASAAEPTQTAAVDPAYAQQQIEQAESDLTDFLGALDVCTAEYCVRYVENRLAELENALNTTSSASAGSVGQQVDETVSAIRANLQTSALCELSACAEAVDLALADLAIDSNAILEWIAQQLPQVEEMCFYKDCVSAIMQAIEALLPEWEGCNVKDCPLLDDVEAAVADLADDVETCSVEYCLQKVGELVDDLLGSVPPTPGCGSVVGGVQTAQLHASAAYATTAASAGSGALDDAGRFDTLVTVEGNPATSGVVIVSLGPGHIVWSTPDPTRVVLAVENIAPDGWATIEMLLPEEVSRAADENGGVVNLGLDVILDSYSYHRDYAFRLVSPPDGPAYLEPVARLPVAIALQPGAAGVYCTADGLPTAGGDLSGMAARCLPQREDHYYRDTTVGEIHTWDGLQARFWYAADRHEESGISGLYKPPGRGWQLGGWAQHERNVGWTYSEPFGSRTATYVRATTRWYHEWDYRWTDGVKEGQSCSSAEIAYPLNLTGQFNLAAANQAMDGHCKSYDRGHRLSLRPGAFMERNMGNAHRYSVAGELFGIGYEAQSGFSENIKLKHKARESSPYDRHWICGTGTDGGPASWKRVFAGPST